MLWGLLFTILTAIAAATTICPLGTNGPDADVNFLAEPQIRGSLGNTQSCTGRGYDVDQQTCCTEEYFGKTQSNTDPFYLSASLLFLSLSPSGSCSSELGEVSCGVCRSHEDAFVEQHTSSSEFRVCLSFCETLLTQCGSEILRFIDDTETPAVSEYYGLDAAGFCYDLFDNVENVKLSVVKDDSSNRQCFSTTPECTDSDFTSFYTECDHAETSRAVYFDYVEGSDCRGGNPLPEPLLGLPCHQTCPAGEFLPIGARECERCAPGTHTVPGFYNDLWKDWPEEFNFDTYCENHTGFTYIGGDRVVDGDCQGWILNDTFIESGDAVGDSQQSVLELKVYLVTSGFVEFEYKVLSEPRYDGLLFLVDDSLVMDLQSQILDWQAFRFELGTGQHSLKWIYFKDRVSSSNLDMAMIDKITVIGTKWADSECDQCSFGYYSEEGSEFCTKCPMNTYSDGYGFFECLDCPESEYSGVGATHCLPRHDCTESDYTAVFGPCEGFSRVIYYQMSQPVLCNYAGFDLPANQTVPCGDCNPGMYRPNDADSCEYCPIGFHSSESGATGSCAPCEAGTFARKAQQYTIFESWDTLPLTTSCSGDCATDGWRLQFTSIDSGVGHGGLVDVNLEITFTLESPGLVDWVYSVECAQFCRFQTVDVGKIGGTKTFYGSQYSQGTYRRTHSIYEAGEHTFRWIFSKNSAGLPEDRLIIHNFTVYGVDEGGSIGCEACPAGTFSEEAAESCMECERGEYSDVRALECLPCPEGTFSNEKGTSSCTACGPNTVSFGNRTGCDLNNCSFEIEGDDENIAYDLSALEIPLGQDIYGPIIDKNGHIYYLNPCTTKHNNNSCVDGDGVPFETHACQKLGSPFDHYVDLGHVQGFLPLEDTTLAEDPVRSGLILTSTSGEPGTGCGNRPRSTNITFLCNPTAGTGYPVGIEPVEAPACFYNFMWASLYACPVCSMNDYVETYGQCSGGVQLLTYLPKTYPSRCHGGQSPPAPQTVPCETTKVDCAPGEYLPFLGNECVLVPAGSYSIGGGVVIETFVEEYLSPVIDPSSNWALLGDFVRSGAGQTYFKIDVFLVQAGYVRFEYKVVAPGLDPTFESGFTFSIDGESIHTVKRYSTDYKYEVYTIPLRSGDHTLVWKFTQGSVPSSEERGNYAIIDFINIYGTDRAARAPTPCKPGFYQNLEGQDFCKPCETDTKSDAGADSCTGCSENHYSLPGSSECEIRQPCEEDDFVVRYTDCLQSNELLRQTWYFLQQPQTCQLTRSFFDGVNGTFGDCPFCPVGYTKEMDQVASTVICAPCPLGYVWSEGEAEPCQITPAGSIPKLIRSYVPLEGGTVEMKKRQERQEGEEESTLWWAEYSADLPRGFSTFSTGEYGATGWRIGNTSLDSGFHSAAEADSILALNVTIVQKGSISFTYEIQPQSDVSVEPDSFLLDGLEFFINGEIQDSVYYHPIEYTQHTASFDLELATNQPRHFIFEWVYHQPSSSPRHNSIILSEITVWGDQTGTAFEMMECEPGTSAGEGAFVCSPCDLGTYAATSGEPMCAPCEAGFFAGETGQTGCEECGKGTQSSVDASDCDLSGCVFTTTDNSKRAYDLSGLDPFVEFEDPDSTGYRYEMSLCHKIPPLMTNCFVEEAPLNTFVCAKNKSTGTSFSTGTLANVGFTHDNVDSPFPQLLMRYNHGAPCRGSNYYTEINFVCDPNVTNSSGVIEFLGQFECATEVDWRTIAGCPICQESDYKKQITECTDSQQSITWIKANDCNGPEILKEESQTCHDYTLPIAVLSLGVFIILVFAIIVIVIRNNKLSERYEKLVHESTRRGSGPAEKPNAGWEDDKDNEKL